MNPVAAFLRRNIVLVITVPSLIGLHYGWYRLQLNENFVPKDEKVKFFGVDLKASEKPQSSTSSWFNQWSTELIIFVITSNCTCKCIIRDIIMELYLSLKYNLYLTVQWVCHKHFKVYCNFYNAEMETGNSFIYIYMYKILSIEGTLDWFGMPTCNKVCFPLSVHFVLKTSSEPLNIF